MRKPFPRIRVFTGMQLASVVNAINAWVDEMNETLDRLEIGEDHGDD